MEDINEIILKNERLIYSIINNSFRNYQNKEDLYQAGIYGMKKAYNNFNPNYGIKFTTYAYDYILGEMKKLVREDRALKVGRNMQRIAANVNNAYIYLSQEYMRKPTILEIATYLNLEEEDVIEAIESSYMVASTDEVINDDGKEITLLDTVEDSRNPNIENLIMLKEELSKLDPFDQKIIQNRYFLDRTQSETASLVGMTQVQVSRREQKILQKMRSNMC